MSCYCLYPCVLYSIGERESSCDTEPYREAPLSNYQKNIGTLHLEMQHFFGFKVKHLLCCLWQMALESFNLIGLS